jgi:thiamine pyrophosphokinase
MKTCYIVGAGVFYGKLSPEKDDLVIAADGGYDTLKKLGITPDLLLGDMDSISTPQDEVEKIVYPVRKDETDTFLAYREGVRRGYTNFVIFGGVGGRDDHTLANFSLLIYGKSRGHSIKIVGERCDIFAIKNESVSVHGAPSAHFSAFAYGGCAKGVTIRGLEYEAENITLTPDFPLAVSNRFTDSHGYIEVKDGTLILMVER